MTSRIETTEWDRMRRQQRSADHGAAIVGRHVIADLSYRAEWIRCTCGTVVTAAEDELKHDRHAPLVLAWGAHKREAAIVRLAQRRTGAWGAA